MEAQPIPGARPGLIGNPAHEVTEEKRSQVRLLARVAGQEAVSQAMGFSVDTLQRYYIDDFNEGKNEAIKSVSEKLLEKALKGCTAEMIFYLKTQGRHHGYSQRMELAGPGGGPIRTVDLSKLIEGKSEEELAHLEQLLVTIGAAFGGEPVPGDDTVGDSAAESGSP